MILFNSIYVANTYSLNFFLINFLFCLTPTQKV